MTHRIILASASPARANLLENAGVAAIRDPSAVDEAAIRESARAANLAVEHCAMRLAEAKALDVADRHPAEYVIGADQILDCAGVWFEKPKSRAEAAKTLRDLRGHEHRLVSAVVVCARNRIIWRHVDTARLTMRPFDDRFLGRYLDLAGDDVLSSVGAYRLEGPGAQLFSAIDGDYFTILGLPLLPLLAALRDLGALDA